MLRIRNKLPGILHVPAAKLRLPGHGTGEIANMTPPVQKEIDAGRIEVVSDKAPVSPTPPVTVPEPPADFDKLGEADAIEYIEDESDPKVLKTILQVERRGSVTKALRARLKELEDARK